MKRVIGLITGVIGVIIITISIILKLKKSASISIIGGADGPTSIFLAGKLGSGFWAVGIICGLILIILAILLLVRKEK